MNIKYLSTILVFFALIFIGCQNGPKPINYGNDECDYCKMMISDAKYGSEFVTEKGKVYKFDSIECLTAYLMKNDVENSKLYFGNFDNPENFIEGTIVIFVRSEKLRSPMGKYLSAHENKANAEDIINEYVGRIMNWNEVQTLVKEEWLKETAMNKTQSNNCECCN